MQGAKAKSKPRVSFAPKIDLVRIPNYDYCRASSGPESFDDDAGSSDECCSSSSTFSPTEGDPPPDKPKFCLEVFCECARLTKHLVGAGFAAMGIDFRQVKDKPEAATRWMDLASREGQEKFWSTIKQHAAELVYVHFAPPCGTASRAREIRRSGKWDPQPLRSDDFPDGLPGVDGVDLARLQSANQLYKFAAEAVFELRAMGVAWSIQNPANSLM